MADIKTIIEDTPEYKLLSRSPNKPETNIELLSPKLRMLAGLNREGTTRLYTPQILFDKANEYFKSVFEDKIESEQLLTGGQNAGTIAIVNKQRMPMLEDLCLFLGLNSKYITHLEEQVKDKIDIDSQLYCNIIQYIRDTIRVKRLQLAAANELNALIVSRIDNLNEKVELSGKLENVVTSITFSAHTIHDAEFSEVNNLLDQE